MAYFQVFCKALRINRIKNDLIKEKSDSVKIERHEHPKLTLKQQWRHCCVDLRMKIRKCCSLPETSCLHRFCYKLKRTGSFENFIAKSILGFIGGFILTYIFFMFFVVQLNFKLSTATIMCSVFGTILMLGLAFSRYIRCIVFLTLPQFFSKRGRQALLAYAFILAITGPAKNTLNNMGILSESLACGQEQLKAAVRQIIEVIKKPFYAIRDAIRSVVKTVKEIVKKIKEILLKIKRIIMAILGVIKAAFQFLGKILNICNKELGTPFQRCARVFDNAIQDCNAKLGPIFSWLCSIAYLVKSVCYIVKIFDYVCMLVDFISDSVIGVVIRKVKSFIRHVRTMFYVRIKFSHSFHFQTNSSKSYSQVAEGIVNEIKERTQVLMVFFDMVSMFTSFFFVFLIIKVIQYRFKFLTSERFDNKYITTNFREIDLQRAKFGKETVLPLNNRERTMYIRISSCRLVKTEKRKLAKAAVILGSATVKLGTHMLVDYCLYWVLNLIRYHARFQSKVKAPNLPSVTIQGEGLLADLLKSIVKAFKPLGIELEIDTVPCLPNPIPPDYDRYIQIVSLLILCWLLTILEPYGLRLRHWIMCYYHPLRAKQRAVWLYNHIMRSRMSFLKFARRQLRRNVKGEARITCKEFLRAKLPCWICRVCLGPDKQEACLLCGEVFRESDEVKAIKCATPGCPGIYCVQCFDDLKNLCTVCLSPIEYGDMSDISEEKGSDDEELPPKKPPPSQTSKKTEDEELTPKELTPKEGVTDEENELKKWEYENKDSGHSSESSQHSYTYQYEKVPEDPALIESSRSRFKDVEKQEIPDYASMESFREIEREKSKSSREEEPDIRRRGSIRSNLKEESQHNGIRSSSKESGELKPLVRGSSKEIVADQRSLKEDSEHDRIKSSKKEPKPALSRDQLKRPTKTSSQEILWGLDSKDSRKRREDARDEFMRQATSVSQEIIWGEDFEDLSQRRGDSKPDRIKRSRKDLGPEEDSRALLGGDELPRQTKSWSQEIVWDEDSDDSRKRLPLQKLRPEKGDEFPRQTKSWSQEIIWDEDSEDLRTRRGGSKPDRIKKRRKELGPEEDLQPLLDREEHPRRARSSSQEIIWDEEPGPSTKRDGSKKGKEKGAKEDSKAERTKKPKPKPRPLLSRLARFLMLMRSSSQDVIYEEDTESSRKHDRSKKKDSTHDGIQKSLGKRGKSSTPKTSSSEEIIWDEASKRRREKGDSKPERVKRYSKKSPKEETKALLTSSSEEIIWDKDPEEALKKRREKGDSKPERVKRFSKKFPKEEAKALLTSSSEEIIWDEDPEASKKRNRTKRKKDSRPERIKRWSRELSLKEESRPLLGRQDKSTMVPSRRSVATSTSDAELRKK